MGFMVLDVWWCLVDGATVARKERALKKYFASFCKCRRAMHLGPKYFLVDTL